MTAIIRRIVAWLRLASYWAQAQIIFAILGLIRLMPAETALGFVAAAARRIGPWMGRHKVAIENLRYAYPDKPETELQVIAGDMWENMARLAAEYVFLDDLFDYDPDRPGDGRIEVVGEELFIKLRDDPAPKIFFTAHLGNFELLPVCAATFDLEVTAMFRPPNNPFIARKVLGARSTKMGGLVPSKAGAAIHLARILERGGSVGMLVDQKFMDGVSTDFFGRECLTNPLLGKLARQFGAKVYPAHCIRLPGGRFRLTLEDAIELPVNEATGRVDVEALMQRVTDKVEEWVRDDPGQWMWFHKRWKITRTRPPRKAR